MGWQFQSDYVFQLWYFQKFSSQVTLDLESSKGRGAGQGVEGQTQKAMSLRIHVVRSVRVEKSKRTQISKQVSVRVSIFSLLWVVDRT